MSKTTRNDNKHRGSEKGFVLLSAAAALIVLLGMCGLAVDIGRMYITKNEAQSYADSAALDAATKLDGTATGIQNATAAASVNTWQFNTTSFTGTTVDFSQDGATGWSTNPSNPANFGYARVTATAQNLGLFFLPVVGTPQRTNIAAVAIAGQILTSGFTANTNAGVFPFSPIAHADGVNSSQVLLNDATGNFGFTPGQFYDMRWPSNPKLTGKGGGNVCAGDATNQWITKADASNNSERGYIQDTSASGIRAAIEDDAMTNPVILNQQVNMTGGAKSTEADALAVRIAQDTDPTTNDYYNYMNAQNGNGRRVVTMAINDGPVDNFGKVRAPGDQNVVVGFAQFFLTAMTYPKAGNQSWCAEYIGPGALVISQSNSAASTNGANGAYVVRLTQ